MPHGQKTKKPPWGGFLPKCLRHLVFSWLLDLGSNQGPTD